MVVVLVTMLQQIVSECIQSANIELDETSLNAGLAATTKNSIAINNPLPAAGGRSAESIIEVKNNALAYFQAQQRAVTKDDYITRVYALPPKYGNVSKAYIVQDSQLDSKSGANSDANRIANPLALNMYLLGFDANKRLTTVNQAVKENIQTYLTQFRMVTDAVNIKNAFVINIGVKFNLLTKVGYNKDEVVLRAIEVVKNYFNIDNWQIGQPIVLADLAYQLSLVDGVSAVSPPEEDNPNGHPVLITNKFKVSGGYSGNVFTILKVLQKMVLFIHH